MRNLVAYRRLNKQHPEVKVIMIMNQYAFVGTSDTVDVLVTPLIYSPDVTLTFK